MFQQAPLPLTTDALQEFGKLFTGYIKSEIRKQQFPYGNPQRDVGDKVASGKLVDSISYEVINGTDGNPTLEISYVDYFENVNLGRRRQKKRVPVKAILDWIKVRGIEGRDRRGIPIPDLSLAFAIQTNIYKFGIRPANIYDKGLDGLLDFVDNPPAELADELQEIYAMIAEDVNNFLVQTINKELPSQI